MFIISLNKYIKKIFIDIEIMNQYNFSDNHLKKLIYIDSTINDIGTAIIDTEDWHQPSSEDEIIKTTSFIASVLTNTLLRSQSLGKEQFDIVVKMEKFGVKSVNFKFVKYMTSILKQLFPERLRQATLIDPPRFFITAYDMIMTFMDKPTRKKLHLISSSEKKEVYEDVF